MAPQIRRRSGIFFPISVKLSVGNEGVKIVICLFREIARQFFNWKGLFFRLYFFQIYK